MGGGAKDARLIGAWTQVVDRLEATDPHTSHFVFAHWSERHPRVADDRVMAGELSSWLRRQPFFKGLPGTQS